MESLFLLGADIKFCSNSANLWQFVGYILMVFKIVVPLLLIIWGAMDLGKAVVASKPEEITKAVTGLAKRALAGIVIFFIPTLVGVIFSIVSGFSDVKSDYDVCKKCVVTPGSCDLSCVKDPTLDKCKVS